MIMVYEKQSVSSPRPPLKANTPRLAGRGTVPPRLAGSPASASSSTTRRDVRNNREPSTPTAQTTEDVSTPVKAFLSSNITPRSGLRKARVDSASTTPTDTPNGTPKAARPVSMVERWDDGLSGRMTGGTPLGISGLEKGQALRAQSVVSEGGRASKPYSRPSSAQSRPTDRNVVSPESLPKFFHANEAKPRLSSKVESQRPPLQTVFSGYTQNGGDDIASSASSLSIGSPPSEGRPKFFRANSSAEAVTPSIKSASRPDLRQPPSQSKSSAQPANSQRAASPLKDEIKPRDSSFHHASNNASLSRPSSLSRTASKDELPSRKPSLSKPSPRRHTRLVSNTNADIQQDIRSPTAAASPTMSTTKTTTDLSRRSSLNLPSPRKASHPRTSSVSGINYPPTRRSSIALSENSTQVSPVVPFRAPPSVPPLHSSPHRPPSITSSQPQPTPPLSPTPLTQNPGQTKLDQLNELAARARRERKVLDLEISNSSLLAINRTLEREMRKQKEELRRLRRVSRRTADGRIVSMGTNRTASSRMSGLSEVMGSEDDAHLDLREELSSECDEDHLSDPYNDDETRSLTSSTSSPPPTRSTFAKDTKRLNVDLSRHRTQLIDSQKLNQAMKRCLDTTESLISDGKKALDYQINLSEIENMPLSPRKGGRVLGSSGDDGDDIGERGQGLLSPAIVSSDNNNPWELHFHNPDNTDHSPEHPDPDPGEEWDIDGIGTAITSPFASPSPAPSHQHSPFSPDSDLSPNSKAALKTGWDAIKQDVKTPDGLRAAAPLGLGNYLQSLGWSPGSGAG